MHLLEYRLYLIYIHKHNTHGAFIRVVYTYLHNVGMRICMYNCIMYIPTSYRKYLCRMRIKFSVNEIKFWKIHLCYVRKFAIWIFKLSLFFMYTNIIVYLYILVCIYTIYMYTYMLYVIPTIYLHYSISENFPSTYYLIFEVEIYFIHIWNMTIFATTYIAKIHKYFLKGTCHIL